MINYNLTFNHTNMPELPTIEQVESFRCGAFVLESAKIRYGDNRQAAKKPEWKNILRTAFTIQNKIHARILRKVFCERPPEEYVECGIRDHQTGECKAADILTADMLRRTNSTGEWDMGNFHVRYTRALCPYGRNDKHPEQEEKKS